MPRIPFHSILGATLYFEAGVGAAIAAAGIAIGPITRAAIVDAERRFGMPPTGRAGQKISRALGAGKGPGGPRAPPCHPSRIQRDAAG